MVVKYKNHLSKGRASYKTGCGLVNTLINNLPFELHIPGYNYCGPGTKLEKRLKRGDVGVNPLDEACKLHDIAYSQSSSLEDRHKADNQLALSAERRWRNSNNLSEKVLALGVNKIMKYKMKRGMGMHLSNVISATRRAVKKQFLNKKKKATHKHLLSAAIKAARNIIKNNPNLRKPRVIPLPKRGGFLPFLPILGALAAAGNIVGGVTTTAKKIYDWVQEGKKGNTTTTPHVVVGKGLYMAPYKKGMGLYLTPYQKN